MVAPTQSEPLPEGLSSDPLPETLCRHPAGLGPSRSLTMEPNYYVLPIILHGLLFHMISPSRKNRHSFVHRLEMGIVFRACDFFQIILIRPSICRVTCALYTFYPCDNPGKSVFCYLSHLTYEEAETQTG